MIEPGTMLDRYECLHPIGKGGMASVWAARLVGKHGFEKLVAIKTMLPEHARDPEFLKMLLDEGHILSGLQHPNVASVLDLGEQDGVFYLVFEWVEGEQLSKVRRSLKDKKKRAPLGITLRMMADTCAGLHAAHEVCDSQGWPLYIIHRDVSPQNLMLATTGDVKIIDFGIAKAMDRVAEDTLSGKLKGKTLYMAPEHVRGEEIDRRIDIWAVGVILYQLLTNRVPLRALKDFELLRLLAANQEPAPLPPSTPASVSSIVMRALRPDRDKRYQTAGEMALDLERAIVAEVGTVTASDVAAFTQEHVGDLIEAKKQAIADVLDRAASHSLTGKHRAARKALASLSEDEVLPETSDTNHVSLHHDSEPSIQKSLSRFEQGSFTTLRPSSSNPIASDNQPNENAAMAHHLTAPLGKGRINTQRRSMAIVTGSFVVLLLVISTLFVSKAARSAADPVHSLPIDALRLKVGILADQVAVSVPKDSKPSDGATIKADEPTVAASASPGASSVPQGPPKTKGKPRPVSTPTKKDPLSVFGTR